MIADSAGAHGKLAVLMLLIGIGNAIAMPKI